MTVVVALGGNALTDNGKLATAERELEIIDSMATELAEIITTGNRLVLTHGNGPQVGGLVLQNETAAGETPAMPFDVCGAMCQGSLGYHIQQSFQRAMRLRGVRVTPVTVVTQVRVNPDDPRFKNPTKPIGPFYAEAEAKRLEAERGWAMREDSNRGWRRVVASPMPAEIVELEAIRCLVENGFTVICAGGGGIPVYRDADGDLCGIAGVIDKDFAAERLAISLGAEVFMMLTAVENAFVDFGKPTRRALGSVTVAEAKKYIAEGQFAVGSMGPKMEAAVRFAESAPGRRAIVTTSRLSAAALRGEAGTTVQMDGPF